MRGCSPSSQQCPSDLSPDTPSQIYSNLSYPKLVLLL